MHVVHDPDRFERNFIGGEWVFSREGYGFDIYDPSNSEVIAAVPLSSRFDVAKASAAASAASADWARLPQRERSAVVGRAVTLIAADLDEIVALEARDTGTPARFLREDIAAAAESACGGIVETAQSASPGERAGAVGVILSWSGPFALCCRQLLPALAGGQALVVKPSLKAPLSAVFFAEILDAAGLPPGVFNLVQGTGVDAGAALAGHGGLSEIWFQGSRQTAKAVARAARTSGASMRACLRRPNLVIVDETADLDAAADSVMAQMLLNAGVAGCGGLAVHVHAGVYEALTARLQCRIDSIRYGSAAAATTDIGPMISETMRAARLTALDELEVCGATTICRAKAPDARTERMGWFAAPCILHASHDGLLANCEIPFGPTIIARALPGRTLRAALHQDGWNTTSLINEVGLDTNVRYGPAFILNACAA